MDSVAASIDHMPSELITGVYRVIGIEASLKTLPSNSKLHRAWQAAVEKVTLKPRLLRDNDVNILAKLVNLTELNFKCCPSDYRQTRHPVWHAIVSAAPFLTRLKSISIVDVPEGFQVLRSIAGMEGLVHRLQVLKIHDETHGLGDDDLWALRSLTALRTLSLAVQSVQPSEVAPRDLCKQLSLLQDLQLTMGLEEESERALFPGSLTSLTSLAFYVMGELPDLEQDEQLLSDAASKLTGLRRLCSDCGLASEEGQREVLAALKQLTYLELQRSSVDDQEEDVFFVMLPELPELVTLIVHQHAACDFLDHPSLQHLEAHGVDVPDEWRGKTAEACKLQHLVLGLDMSYHAVDEHLANLPLLPDLRSIILSVFSDIQEFRSTAALLRRQASRLEQVRLGVMDATFEEALPRELPVCSELWLSDCSRATLQLLAMCSMPRLEVLTLHVVFDFDGHSDDLAWLRSCPCLRKVTVITPWSFPASDDVKAEVAQMMEGSSVELEWQC